jgi:hypothetical protein
MSNVNNNSTISALQLNYNPDNGLLEHIVLPTMRIVETRINNLVIQYIVFALMMAFYYYTLPNKMLATTLVYLKVYSVKSLKHIKKIFFCA